MSERREAIKRMAMGALGVAGALSGAKAQATGQVLWPSGNNSPPSAQNAVEDMFTVDKYDPTRRAREVAAEPLRKRIDDLGGYSRFNIREFGPHNWDYAQRSYKSASEWFRNSVSLDRAKASASLLDQLRAEYQSLITSPLDKLSRDFQNSVSEALKDF